MPLITSAQRVLKLWKEALNHKSTRTATKIVYDYIAFNILQAQCYYLKLVTNEKIKYARH